MKGWIITAINREEPEDVVVFAGDTILNTIDQVIDYFTDVSDEEDVWLEHEDFYEFKKNQDIFFKSSHIFKLHRIDS